jgi:hypothetical protein
VRRLPEGTPVAILKELGIIKKADWSLARKLMFEDTSDLGQFVMSFNLPEHCGFKVMTLAGPDTMATKEGGDLNQLKVRIIQIGCAKEVIKFKWNEQKRRFVRQKEKPKSLLKNGNPHAGNGDGQNK